MDKILEVLETVFHGLGVVLKAMIEIMAVLFEVIAEGVKEHFEEHPDHLAKLIVGLVVAMFILIGFNIALYEIDKAFQSINSMLGI